MGESATRSARIDSRWSAWSQRLALVCLSGALLLGAALLAPYNPLGYVIPPLVFTLGFGAGFTVLLIWISTGLQGVDCTLPAAKPPFGWVTPVLLFILIALRYVLALETGLLGFLAFRSTLPRYGSALIAVYGLAGMIRALAAAFAQRRANLRESS